MWIWEVVIVTDQSSNRELSAGPDSVESEMVPKLESFPAVRGDVGSGGGVGRITAPCLATVSLTSDVYSQQILKNTVQPKYFPSQRPGIMEYFFLTESQELR